jgi:hypothetical protein
LGEADLAGAILQDWHISQHCPTLLSLTQHQPESST